MNIACVSADGLNIGTNKNKRLNVTMICVAIVVNIMSIRSTILTGKGNSKFFGIFLNVLQHPKICSGAN